MHNSVYNAIYRFSIRLNLTRFDTFSEMLSVIVFWQGTLRLRRLLSENQIYRKTHKNEALYLLLINNHCNKEH